MHSQDFISSSEADCSTFGKNRESFKFVVNPHKYLTIPHHRGIQPQILRWQRSRRMRDQSGQYNRSRSNKCYCWEFWHQPETWGPSEINLFAFGNQRRFTSVWGTPEEDLRDSSRSVTCSHVRNILLGTNFYVVEPSNFFHHSYSEVSKLPSIHISDCFLATQVKCWRIYYNTLSKMGSPKQFFV